MKHVSHSCVLFFCVLWCLSYLGEVEHDIDKNKRDAKHKDPEDQVKGEEPD